jgi:tRNA G18 (ribose-2'-O)-methylase SpoU
MVFRVEDPGDERLDDYRSLHDPAGRRRREEREAIFVVEGRLAVAELLRSAYEVRSLLVDDHQAKAAAGLVEGARAAGASVYVGTREVVAATVGFDLHRGVVAVARRPAPADPRELLEAALGGEGGRRGVLAVLEGLNDHENLGAIFRNAAAFGVAGVLLDPTCADPLYRRCVRVSLGHVLRVPFARLAPFPAGLASLRSGGMALVALTPRPGDDVPVIPLAHLASTLGKGSAVALLAGAEGPGLSDAALAEATVRARIPMAPGVDSLNVATAAAVALYALHAAPAGPG